MFNRKQWFLAYSIFGKKFSFKNLKFIFPPKDRIWADPFPLKINERFFIFFEELIYGNKGHISYIELNKNGTVLEKKLVLEEKFHLSYPFVFKHNNSYYMIPESHKSNSIRLYKSVKFPEKWVFQQDLIEDIDAVDTNLIRIKDFWYLFTSSKISSKVDRELSIFKSPELEGNWVNIGNYDYGRNAGKFLFRKNKIYRLVQNSVKHYGESINFNYVKLKDNIYAEVEDNRLSPSWLPNLISTHTLNMDQNFLVMDGQIPRRSFFYIKFWLNNLYKRILLSNIIWKK